MISLRWPSTWTNWSITHAWLIFLILFVICMKQSKVMGITCDDVDMCFVLAKFLEMWRFYHKTSSKEVWNPSSYMLPARVFHPFSLLLNVLHVFNSVESFAKSRWIQVQFNNKKMKGVKTFLSLTSKIGRVASLILFFSSISKTITCISIRQCCILYYWVESLNLSGRMLEV
jgi:hypothetical protein